MRGIEREREKKRDEREKERARKEGRGEGGREGRKEAGREGDRVFPSTGWLPASPQQSGQNWQPKTQSRSLLTE